MIEKLCADKVINFMRPSTGEMGKFILIIIHRYRGLQINTKWLVLSNKIFTTQAKGLKRLQLSAVFMTRFYSISLIH